MIFNDILGHISNSLYALGFAIKNMLWLRLAIIAGCVIEIIYRMNISESALWTDVPWCTIYIVLNAVQIAILMRDQSMSRFTEEEKRIYKLSFNNFSPGDFQKLLKIAGRKTFHTGQVLMEEGVQLDYLVYISDGLCEVNSDGKLIANVRSGSFAGEMSFMTGRPTSAQVRAAVETHCFVWPKAALKELMEKKTEIEDGLKTVFNADLISKLSRSDRK
jgi:hypothetical protein